MGALNAGKWGAADGVSAITSHNPLETREENMSTPTDPTFDPTSDAPVITLRRYGPPTIPDPVLRHGLDPHHPSNQRTEADPLGLRGGLSPEDWDAYVKAGGRHVSADGKWYEPRPVEPALSDESRKILEYSITCLRDRAERLMDRRDKAAARYAACANLIGDCNARIAMIERDLA